MYNEAGMKAVREEYKDADKRHAKGERSFPFLDPKDLGDGDYYIRMFPKNPQSNPSGYRIVGKHYLEGSIAEKNQHGNVKKKMFTCGAIRLKNGKLDKSGECFFCQVYRCLEDPDVNFFEEPGVDDGVRKAAGGLSPAIEYWFVISIMAHRRKEGEYYKYSPAEFGGENEHGAIFSVTQESVIDGIFDALREGKKKHDLDLTEADETGGYLLLSKRGNRYEVTVSDQIEIEIQNGELLPKYPKSFETMGAKSIQTPVQAAAFLQNKDACWWGRSLKKFVNLDPDEGDEDDVELELEDEDEEEAPRKKVRK